MKEIRFFIREKDAGYTNIGGWGFGYVVIPKDHPYWGLPYNKIDVEVYGGLTFGAPADEIMWPELPPNCSGCYVYGFDTLHDIDCPDLDKDFVLGETQRLARQFQNAWPNK